MADEATIGSKIVSLLMKSRVLFRNKTKRLFKKDRHNKRAAFYRRLKNRRGGVMILRIIQALILGFGTVQGAFLTKHFIRERERGLQLVKLFFVEIVDFGIHIYLI